MSEIKIYRENDKTILLLTFDEMYNEAEKKIGCHVPPNLFVC